MKTTRRQQRQQHQAEVSHGCKNMMESRDRSGDGDGDVDDDGGEARHGDKRLKMCKTNSSTTIQHFELDLGRGLPKNNNENRKSRHNKAERQQPQAAALLKHSV